MLVYLNQIPYICNMTKFNHLTQDFIDFFNVYMGRKKPIEGYFSKDEIKEEIKRIESDLKTITPSALNSYLTQIDACSETMLQSTLLVLLNEWELSNDKITKSTLLKYSNILSEIKQLNSK